MSNDDISNERLEHFRRETAESFMRGHAEGLAEAKSRETYNGWTNRETWAVALHINNDQGWQESVHEALRSQIDCGPELGTELAPWQAGDIIRANVEATIDPGEAPDADLGHTLACLDILADIGSLWRVNWDELGASFLSDLDES